MDVNDLMLGDWIEDGYKKAQVTSITCDGIVETTAAISNIEVVDPIPITKEILVKNGFQKLNDKTFLLKNQIEIEVGPKFSEVSAQKMLCERVDYEVKITRDIHLESQTQSSMGDIKI